MFHQRVVLIVKGSGMSRVAVLLRLWLVTSRPALYPFVPIIIMFGYQASGGTLATLTPTALLVLALYTLPFSLVVYGLNDIHDYQSDSRNTKRHWLTGGVAAPVVHHQILMGVFIAICALLLTMLLLGNQLLTLMVTSTIVFAYLYSVPPFRLKSRPVADCLVSGFGYIILPFLIGTALNQQLLLLPEIIILTVFASACHLFCSVRDYEADAAAGDMTTAVYLGIKIATVFVMIISAVTTVWWWGIHPHDWLGICFFASLGALALITLIRPRYTHLAVNVMVPIATLVALEKLLW